MLPAVRESKGAVMGGAVPGGALGSSRRDGGAGVARGRREVRRRRIERS